MGQTHAHLSRIQKFYSYGRTPLSGARLAFLAESCSLLGKLGIKLPFTIDLSIGELRETMRVRDRRDLAVVEEVFVQKDYDFEYLPDARVIVDIGSNIGASVRYFSMIFPAAHVYCFEPNPIAVARLVDNTCGHSVTYCPVAVSNHDGFLSFFAERSKHASSSLIERGESSLALRIPSWSLKTLIEKVGGTIDLLKFDVEGAEVDLLANVDLRNVREMVGEVHLDLIAIDMAEFIAMLPGFEVIDHRPLSETRHILHLRNLRVSSHGSGPDHGGSTRVSPSSVPPQQSRVAVPLQGGA